MNNEKTKFTFISYIINNPFLLRNLQIFLKFFYMIFNYLQTFYKISTPKFKKNFDFVIKFFVRSSKK